MNIAFPTLIILFLLLPGIVFRRFYYTEEFSKEFFKAKFENLLTFSLLPSVLIHLLTISNAYLVGYSIDFKILSYMLSGISTELAVDNVSSHINQILVYFVLSFLYAVFLGMLCKRVVRFFQLDIKYKLFRFQNEWHYFFSGEIMQFPRTREEWGGGDIAFRYLDIMVASNDEIFIYRGLLADYILSGDGGIDRIYLSQAEKKCIPSSVTKSKDFNLEKSSSNISSDFKAIEGNLFAIPFNHVMNINITYYEIMS